MSTLAHLSHRFFGSITARNLSVEETAWVGGILSHRELALWRKMSKADQLHGLEVAKSTESALGTAVTTETLSAALLHDVGKTAANLGTYGRVIATISARVVGYEMAPGWASKKGFTRRVGLYLQHDRLGAQMLELAGSHPLVVSWALEHHLPEQLWTVPNELGRVLRDADDD